MMLPRPSEPIHAHLEDVFPEFLVERLGGGPGARALASVIFRPGFNDTLAANLAEIAWTFRTAARLAEAGHATQEERETVTRAIRIYAVLLDDGLNKYVTRELVGQEKPPYPFAKGNRSAMFSIAEDIFRKHLPFTYKLTRDPSAFGVNPEDADLLLGDVQQLGRVLAAEPKTHDKEELRAHLQEVNRRDYEKILMAAGILSWEDAFDGDIGNIRALRKALERLGKRLKHLRMEET